MSTVIVAGAGIAGTAAALSASRAGATAYVFDGGSGASTLATGALGSSEPGAPAESLSADAHALVDSLGAYSLPDGGATLLTTAGIVRRARGHDRGLLDVGRLGGACIGVVRCHRPGWDADLLAQSWGDKFIPLDADIVRHSDEHVLPDVDFASRHDDPARLQWLGDRLLAALARTDGSIGAVALPPCLGVDCARAVELTRRTRVRCGEAIAAPGGPSGQRFERARDRAFATSGVQRFSARATRIERKGDRWLVFGEEGVAIDGDAVVVAIGGIIGGGIDYTPSDAIFATALPPHPRPTFALTVDAPIALGMHGRPLELASSLFGASPESIARSVGGALERVGALADVDGRSLGTLFIAGDLLADAPRTWLSALESGVRAGLLSAGAARSAALRAGSPSRP